MLFPNFDSLSTELLQVSECSSPRIRGALGSFTATFLSLGIVIAYIVGAFVEWQTLCFLIGSLPIVLGLAMVKITITFQSVANFGHKAQISYILICNQW